MSVCFFSNRLLNVSSITVDTTISKCMKDEKPILPSDTSIFLFSDVAFI